MRIAAIRRRFPRTRSAARALAARLRPWRSTWRILGWSSAGALFVAAVGWASPMLAGALSGCLWVVGIPSAILFSIYFVHRARILPPAVKKRDSEALALLVVAMVLLVPANLVPTKGKKWWMKRQGRAAAAALERQHKRTGCYPERLGDVEGAPWLRVGLRYSSTWQDYELSFDDPGYHLFDFGLWSWDRTARTWRYEFYD